MAGRAACTSKSRCKLRADDSDGFELPDLPFEPRLNSFKTEPNGVMVFWPTLEEMQDFPSYIRFMEAVGAQAGGVAKVVPPAQYMPSKPCINPVDTPFGDTVVKSPILQHVQGGNGTFSMINITQKSMTVKQFKEKSESKRFCPPNATDPEEIERQYWRNVTFNNPIYGADVMGSITDPDFKLWNINHLNTILDDVERINGTSLPGVNTAYLYFGMWKASFCWHTEDMDLYSINYIHHGAPKQWYAINPADADRFERLARSTFAHEDKECHEFLRHKTTLLSPQFLKANNVPFTKTVHSVGEFIITFPRAYHSGFNHGFNIAESTNFASEAWLDVGKKAKFCTCSPDSVRIDMGIFLKIYRPKEFEQLVDKRTEEHKKLLAAVRRDGGDTAPLEASFDPSSGLYLVNATSTDTSPSMPSPMVSPKTRPVAPPRPLTRKQPKRRAPENSTEQVPQRPKRSTEPTETVKPKRAAPCSVDLVKAIQAANDKLSFVSGDTYKCQICDRHGRLSAHTVVSRDSHSHMNMQATPPSFTPFNNTAVQRSIMGQAQTSPLKTQTQMQPSEDLVRCLACHVVVHRACYGSSNTPQRDHWLCNKCAECVHCARCSLCTQIAGAFKRLDTWGWAHVSCALWVPETTFDGTYIRGLNMIPAARLKLRCSLCNNNPNMALPGYESGIVCPPMASIKPGQLSKLTNGAPIQCGRGKCTRAFHVSCAQQANLSMQTIQSRLSDNQRIAFCNLHKPKEIEIPVFRSVGDKVFAPGHDGKYYPGTVCAVSQLRRAQVRFLTDGSVSNKIAPQHLFEEDGLTRAKIDKLTAGTLIYVLQSKIYKPAEFVSAVFDQRCQIQFLDNYVAAVETSKICDNEAAVPAGKLGVFQLVKPT